MQTSLQADQVTLTGTGYFGASRRDVRQLAWRLGAAYCGDMTHGVTTHLVCKDVKQPVTEKVRVAAAWGIPVLDHAWLLDSVAQQALLPVEKYAVVPPSLLADRLTPVTVTARSSKHISGEQELNQPQPHTDASSVHSDSVELLRAADSPTNCQLADLLLSTILSPVTGSSYGWSS